MERFDLARWEVPRDCPEPREGVAQQEFWAQWQGEERRFLLRRIEWKPGLFVLFARKADSSEEGNWLIYQSESWNLPPVSDARCERILRHPQKFASSLVSKFRRIFVIRFQTTCQGDIIKSRLLFVFVFPQRKCSDSS